MASYNYTHGGTTDRDRLRFLLGDHRGATGAFTGTNQVFSDEELDDLLLSTMANGGVLAAARIALQSSINRNAMAAGVSGTTDTTDRPAALIQAIRQLERISYPLGDALPQAAITANSDLDDASDMGD